MTVVYQPFDGSDGLQSQENQLLAWSEGEEVARGGLSRDEDMQSLLWSFRAADLLPEINFSLTPREVVSDLELDLTKIYEGTLIGSGDFVDGDLEGMSFRWRAQYVQEDIFTFSSPPGTRPWEQEEERGFGWQIFLPTRMYEEHDFVLLQRVGLGIESFLYALASRRDIAVPYRCRIRNSFSATNPAWRVGPPQIIPF